MKTVRYPAEFKAEAVRQVTERGHGVVDVAKRLGMSDKSLYLWVLLTKDRAVWRRRPKNPVMIHSDQGSQFGSDEFNRWCKDNQLVPSMSRRGNCWDNAVAESFFSNLKKERIKRRIYASRQ